MFEPITKLFFNIWNSFRTQMTTQTNALIQRYPNQAFKMFWLYNYYSVVFFEYLEKNKIYVYPTVSFSLPIENEYFARFFYYVSTQDKYNLYFEHSLDHKSLDHKSLDHKSSETTVWQYGEMHLYKTPDYILCGFSLPEDVKKQPTQCSAKFINVIFSNESTREPLTIKLDKSYFQVGNEILTAAHILLLLKLSYLPTKFVFDNKYELKIMDGAFNLVVLKYNEWIKFDDSKLGYVKMTATSKTE